ncbi:hypothetical protein ACWEIM_32345 [Streptomyces sp. NPDC004778]
MANIVELFGGYRSKKAPTPLWYEVAMAYFVLLSTIAYTVGTAYFLFFVDMDKLAGALGGTQLTWIFAGTCLMAWAVVYGGFRYLILRRMYYGDNHSMSAAIKFHQRRVEREMRVQFDAEKKAWEEEREEWKLQQTGRLYRQVMDQKSRGVLRDNPEPDDLAG